MDEKETNHPGRYLFGDNAGLDSARRIDRKIDRLAGLGGLGLLESAIADANVRDLVLTNTTSN